MIKLAKLLILPVCVFSMNAHAATATSTAHVLSLTDTTATLKNDFKTAPVWRAGGTQPYAAPKPLSDRTFTWAPGYIWNHAIVGTAVTWPPNKWYFPAWTSNGNANADPNADMMSQMAPDLKPLKWSPGMLTFTVRPMPAHFVRTISSSDPKGYMGASITSFPYSQTYGVFSITAKLPKGKGIWPAFWLLPADNSWPPEIDVMELLGANPSLIYQTVHSLNASKQHQQSGSYKNTGVDLSQSFHEYAVDWGPDTIKWYFDRTLIFTAPTPASLKKPCYLIVNVAVGSASNWGGAPDAKTVFPASMQVTSIMAYQRATYASALTAAAALLKK